MKKKSYSDWTKKDIEQVIRELPKKFTKIIDEGRHPAQYNNNIDLYKKFNRLYPNLFLCVPEFLNFIRNHKKKTFVKGLFCLGCGERNKFKGSYPSHCSRICSNLDTKLNEIRKENREESNLSNYGVKCLNQLPGEAKRRAKVARKNLQEKHGVDNVSQLSWVKEKNSKAQKSLRVKQQKIETSRRNWGCDYPNQSPIIKEKHIQTNRRVRGVDNPFQDKKLMEEVYKRNIETFGYKHKNCTKDGRKHLSEVNSSKDVLLKSQKTCVTNWNTPFPMRDERVLKKRQKTNLKKYGAKEIMSIPKFRKKAEETCKQVYGTKYPTQTDEIKEKVFLSKKENESFNSSQAEEDIFLLLQRVFKKVIRQYKDARYPFACDFYIPSIDLFIEYQGYKTHNRQPFDPKKKEHKNILIKWQRKAWSSKFANTFVKVWTQTDPLKRKTAKKNGLNWVEFFSFLDFRKWLADYYKNNCQSNVLRRDNSIMADIEKFLTRHHIRYEHEKDSTLFKLYKTNEDESYYRIRYISPESHSSAYPNYGLDGIPFKFFFKKQQNLEKKDKFNLFIRSYEWQNNFKRRILKSNILHAMGKTKISFYGRDMEIKLVSNKEIREFQKENCFYGYRPAALNLALILKKEKFGYPAGTVVMIMTFGYNFFGKKKFIEVYRVGTLRRTQVVGGITKLLTYLFRNYQTIKVGRRNYPIDKIRYYLDWDHNRGINMEANGFIFDKATPSFHNYDPILQEYSQRKPMKHKKVMEMIHSGVLLSIPIVGVKSYWIHKESFV
jgi:hypothetical protein